MEHDVNKYDQLAKDFPAFVQGFHGFGVGDGWYDLIRALCGMINNYVENHNKDVEYRLGLIAEGKKQHTDWSPDLLTPIQMPRIMQVKEKFGGLRFYINGGDKRIQHWIEFAEAMSYKICEDCGAPGTVRNDTGWVHVKCDLHEAEYKAELEKRYA